jgi:hypothetical protein
MGANALSKLDMKHMSMGYSRMPTSMSSRLGKKPLQVCDSSSHMFTETHALSKLNIKHGSMSYSRMPTSMSSRLGKKPLRMCDSRDQMNRAYALSIQDMERGSMSESRRRQPFWRRR